MFVHLWLGGAAWRRALAPLDSLYVFVRCMSLFGDTIRVRMRIVAPAIYGCTSVYLAVLHFVRLYCLSE